ncbi:Fc.00g004440.m01.CDS01 [Cosmosporella sp. VM-42]
MKQFLLSASLFSSWAVVYAQVVQWDIQKHHALPRLQRRASGPVLEEITNELSKGGYFSTVSVGTPGQNLKLQLDTGSSDLWIPWSEAPICRDTSIGCHFGSFDPKKSSSFDNVAPDKFQIQYVDGTSATGDYITDRIEIGGAILNNFTMGFATKSNVAYGLAGVGYAINEASTELNPGFQYRNLPVALSKERLIKTVAYSLWLNDLSSSTGSILFGGVDTEKYVGDITRLEILKTGAQYRDFSVPLTSLVATSPSGTDTLTSPRFPISVVLDCGTTLSYLPQDVVEQLWEEVGAVYWPDQGAGFVPCSYANHEGHFSFQFAGPEGPRINITMDELVVDLSRGDPPNFPFGKFKGEPACLFGISNITGDTWLLGDTFLRSAYVVYDLVNNEIGMAATDFNSTKTNVIPFKSKGARIPSSTPIPKGQSTQGLEVKENNFTASKGFQAGSDDDNGNTASPVAVIGPSFAVVGVMIAFMLLESSLFSNFL